MPSNRQVRMTQMSMWNLPQLHVSSSTTDQSGPTCWWDHWELPSMDLSTPSMLSCSAKFWGWAWRFSHTDWCCEIIRWTADFHGVCRLLPSATSTNSGNRSTGYVFCFALWLRLVSFPSFYRCALVFYNIIKAFTLYMSTRTYRLNRTDCSRDMHLLNLGSSWPVV